MGRPGLIGTMARTAVVAGTATAVVGGMQGHQQARAQAAANQDAANQAAYQSQAEIDAMQQQMAAMQAQQQAAPAPAAAPAQDDMLTQLAKLGQMNQAGLIDDAEFAAAKAKLLGI
jgi:alpha-D-ribose 1-methylphosphonate 5-triphosphate synthase subunit PhnG